MPANDIKLTFINESNDQNNSNVVIFQAVNPFENEMVQPSQTVADFAPGEARTVEVGVSGYAVQVYATGNGNGSNMTPVTAGQAYKVEGGPYTHISVVPNGAAKDAYMVEIVNDMQEQMTVDIFNNGNNVGMTGAQPGGTATLSVGQIHVGITSQKEYTPIAVHNITSGKVVMGGGNGLPYTFTLVSTDTKLTTPPSKINL
jgi:hypothetical protein